MTYQYLRVDVEENGVAVLTLDWPEKHNALSRKSMADLVSAFQRLAIDDDIRVIVLTGSGDRSFCSGADLSDGSEDGSNPIAARERFLRTKPMGHFGNLMLCLRSLSKPVIAAVNGYAVGGGFSLALGCDIRIASENAKFNCMHVRRGMMPDAGVTFILPRMVGTARALELMWTGDMLDANEAREIGLVSRVVPADQLLDEVKELAGKIARGASIPIELAKKAVYAAEETNRYTNALVWESWGQELCIHSEDGMEGLTAFFEKREPRFTGK